MTFKLFGLAAVLTFMLWLEPHALCAQETTLRGPEASEWYGWQILVADVSVIGTSALLFSTHALDPLDTLLITAVGYTTLSPIIHAAHDRPLVGLALLGIRVLAPLVAVGASSGVHGDVDRTRLAVLLTLGLGGVTVIDAATSWMQPAS